MIDGFMVWSTGLPCSGKTTLSRLLASHLRSLGYRVEVLDGDEVRGRLSHELGFRRHNRDLNIRGISYVPHFLSRSGVIAIAGGFSLYLETSEAVRSPIGRLVEFHVECRSKSACYGI